MVVIFGFDINVELPWDPLLSITKDTFREASYFAIFCHAFLTFGMCTVLYKRRTFKVCGEEKDLVEERTRQLKLLRSVGMICVLVGIIPMLYIDLSRVMLYMNGDYLDTYKVGVNGFIVIISRFTEIGAVMLLIGNHKNKKEQV